MTTAAAPNPAADPEVRSTGIGGSDVPIILGLSPYASPFDLWARKVGMAPEQPYNRGMTWGTILEDTVARHYARVTGAKIRRVTKTLRHRDKPWLLAHLDRMAYVPAGIGQERRVLEVKTGSAFDATWERTEDGLPIHVLLQVLHYLAVTGLARGDVAALLGGSDFRIYHVDWDQELWDSIEPKLTEFWRQVVERDAPPLDGSDSTAELLRAMYPRADPGRVLEMDPEEWPGLADAMRSLRLARLNVKSVEEVKATQEAIIKATMEDATELIVPGIGRVTWRNDRDTEVVNWEGYAKHLEGLLQATPAPPSEHHLETVLSVYTNPKAGSRRFLPKFEEDA